MTEQSQTAATFLHDDAIPQKKQQAGNFKTSFYNPFEIKHRKRTSRAQFKVLEKTFLENPKPNASVRRWLAQQLVMTPRGVQVWFQNRRAKEKAKKITSEPLVMQQSTSDESTPASSPSCACPDCFATPMTRTMSYPFEEDMLTPVTPLDIFMGQTRKYFPNQWSPNQWNLMGDQDLMMRRLYDNNAMMLDTRRYYTAPLFEDKSIQSTELFRRLSEPIYNTVNFNTSYNLIPRSNSFTAL